MYLCNGEPSLQQTWKTIPWHDWISGRDTQPNVMILSHLLCFMVDSKKCSTGPCEQTPPNPPSSTRSQLLMTGFA